MKKTILLTFSLLTFLIGCGSDKDKFDEEKERQEETNQEHQGFYETMLVPINTGLAGSSMGNFRIRILGDEVKVRGEMENTPRVFHRQFIHTGPNCPGPGADTNLDGNLSLDESLRITGPSLIPLDQNLSTQKAGYTFPVAGAMGAYTYFETTSLLRMSADLRSEDPDPSDYLTKLSPNENLNLAGRTIVVYGSVGNSSLPIACGSLRRSVEPIPDPAPRPDPVPLPPRVPWDNSFNTRLSNDLLISGTKCPGDEECLRNQWRVTVDNINTCTPGGGCTEVGILPFIANLVLVRNGSNATTAYYNILPVSPVDNQTFRDANEHWVRFMRGSAPLVLKKPQR